MMERIVAGALIGGTRLLTGAQCRWMGCAPEDSQRIYFANHTSHLDFVLLWSALPPVLRVRTRPVAAADYWQRGRVRPYLISRVFGGVLVDRAVANLEQHPLAPMLAALDRGESLIIFPEGTRGEGKELLPFKAGIFHLAMARPEIDLVPVWMSNLYRVMPKGSLLPVPLLCSATFGAPARLQANEEKTAFLERLRGELMGVSQQ
jgi:1-acyl-sn-glycerol-3-phosphate acyltransferase